jgi:transposase-like protein
MIPVPELLSDPVYHDEEAARLYVQEVRWPDGVFCPFCGTLDNIRPLGGPSMGPGWFYCPACQDKFTVRMGSIFERSHIPLHKWLLAFRLMASSKKGVSAHQLHRTLGITYKSAWFLGHRIRECMTETDPTPLGGEGKTVEADETYFGKRAGFEREPDQWVLTSEGWRNMTDRRSEKRDRNIVVTLVERDGKARSVHVDDLTLQTLNQAVTANADKKSALMTDELRTYRRIGRQFASHDSVNHSEEEYVRKLKDGRKAHTNTVEGYYSIFKRGMKGIYQHCSEKHLPRYLAEFDFRYSYRVRLGVDDMARTTLAIEGAAGKRLTYRRTRSPLAAQNARALRRAR